MTNSAPCNNPWHRGVTGGLIACPLCGKTDKIAARPAPPARNRPRVQLKHFEGVDVPEVVARANEWLTKQCSQPNVEIMDVRQLIHHEKVYVIVGYAVL